MRALPSLTGPSTEDEENLEEELGPNEDEEDEDGDEEWFVDGQRVAPLQGQMALTFATMGIKWERIRNIRGVQIRDQMEVDVEVEEDEEL